MDVGADALIGPCLLYTNDHLKRADEGIGPYKQISGTSE